jgi:catechol 2,3-dioxygenase
MSLRSKAVRGEIRFSPRRVAHGNFFVSDLEASMRYYNEVLGLREVFREPGIGAGFLSNGSSHHDVGLIQVTDKTLTGRDGQVQVSSERGRTPGLNHIGFEMETEAELVAAYERARDAGVAIHRTVNHQISHSVYLFDPDGNYLEFYADADQDWRAIYEAHAGELITGNWKPDLQAASTTPKYVAAPEFATVTNAALTPRRAARVSLLVSDLSTLLAFYDQVVGLTLVAGGVDDGFAVLSGAIGNWDVGLFQVEATSPCGLHHFGFELGTSDELDEAVRRLERQGVEPEIRLSHATKESVAVLDRDGILLEFFIARSSDPGDLRAPVDPLPFLV